MNTRALTAPTSALLLALLTAWAPPLAAAQDAPAGARAGESASAVRTQGFEHVLPEDTCLFVGTASADEFERNFSASTTGRFWADPGCEPMRRHISEFMERLGARMKEAVGVDPLPLFGMLHGPVALAVVGLPEAQDLVEDTLEGVGMVLLADLGEEREEGERIVMALVDRMAELPNTRRETEVLGDEDVVILRSGRLLDSGEDPALRITFHRNTLVACLDAGRDTRDVLMELLDGLEGRPADTLAALPAFRSSLATETGGLQMWADLGGFARMGMEIARLEEEEQAELSDDSDEFAYEDSGPFGDLDPSELMRKLGLQELGALSMNAIYGAQGSQARMRVDWPGTGWAPRLLRLLLGPGAQPALPVVPVSCLSMTAAHVDFGGLFDEVFRIAIETGQVEPPDLVGLFAQMEEALGFDLREDLLSLLSNQLTVISAETEPEEAFMGTEANPMNFAVVLGLKDGARFNTLLDDLIRSQGLHATRQRQEFQGHEIYSVPLLGFSVHYSVLPDALVISAAGTMVQDVLRRRGGGDLPSLARDRDYAEAVKDLRSAPGMLMYSNTAKQMEGTNEAIDNLLEMLDTHPADGGFEAEFMEFLKTLPLPDEAVIRKHFVGGSASAITFDDRGLQLESYAR